MTLHIAPLTADHLDTLADLLVDTVASGGSVGFMHPLARDKALAFWQRAFDDMAVGGRVILGAFVDGELASTVSLILDMPENQPHRAEIGKMMTALRHRGQGAAMALLHAAEELAVSKGRTHLMLDTAEIGGAAGLYEKAGFVRAGLIPDFALLPTGGLSATLIYWKRIGA